MCFLLWYITFQLQSLSDKYKSNRALKKMVQLTGKKSYARVREELQVILLNSIIYVLFLLDFHIFLWFNIFLLHQATLGRTPSRVDMFRKCFSRNGNTKGDEAKNAIVSKIISTLIILPLMVIDHWLPWQNHDRMGLLNCNLCVISVYEHEDSV